MQGSRVEALMPALPAVSVVIPCRDAAPWLRHQLEAVMGQDYDGAIDVVVADNGSTDGSAEVAAAIPGVRVVDAAGVAAPNVARRVGADAAREDLILFTDADDVVHPGWVSAMVRALQEFDLVTGVMDVDSLNEPSVRRFRRRKEGPRFGFLPAAHGSNFGIRRAVLESIGSFDESVPYGSCDIDIAWRAQVAGYTMGVVDDAVVSYRLRANPRTLRTQAYLQGASLPALIRRYRRAGMSYRGVVVRAIQFIGFLTVTLPLIPLVPSIRHEWLRRASVARGFARGLFHPGER